MKKAISFILAVLLTLPVFTFSSFAQGEEVEVNAKSAILMDVATGKVLYAENEHEQLYPASVTKIMPMLLFMEAIDSGKMALTDTVTTSPAAASKGGSQIWLKEGEQMTVDELLRATAIGSANDACTALGEHLSGSEEAFVKQMNERAAQLGMENTHFDNCSGLDDDTTTHLTTAYDIALMSRELLRHERIRTYTTVWMDSLRGGATELVNTNRLVRFYNGTTGLKTGTTSKAGHCLSASAERDGLHLVAVVMGAANSTDRFEGAKNLLNWGFANFECYTPEFDASVFSDVTVIRGIENTVKPVITEVDSVMIEAGQKSSIETEIELAADVEAPVEENQVLGKVKLKIGSETLKEYPLIALRAVRRITFGDIVIRFLKSLTKSEQFS